MFYDTFYVNFSSSLFWVNLEMHNKYKLSKKVFKTKEIINTFLFKILSNEISPVLHKILKATKVRTKTL